MKNLLYIFYIFLIVSCKKEKLPELPVSNAPIFLVEGTIDGHAISMSAGEDNYFMHSEEFEFHNVTQWKGSLSNGKNILDITLSDGIVDVPNSTYDLSQVEYISLTEMPTSPLLHLDKNDLSNANYIQSVTWYVDGELYASQGPLVIYEPGIYDICAEVTFINQSQATNCSEVILGYDRNAKGALRFIIGQNNTLIAFFDTPEYEIEYVEWFYNDSLVSSNNVNLNLEMNENSCHLKGIVHYKNGVIRTRTTHVNKIYKDFYIQDLTAFENQSSTSWDFKIRMNVNFNGQQYRGIESTTINTQLKITSIQEYGYNSSGDKVILIKGKLDTPLLNLETETVVNASLTLSFALPYK